LVLLVAVVFGYVFVSLPLITISLNLAVEIHEDATDPGFFQCPQDFVEVLLGTHSHHRIHILAEEQQYIHGRATVGGIVDVSRQRGRHDALGNLLEACYLLLLTVEISGD